MPAILSARNLGKSYRVNHAAARGRHRYRTLRDELVDLATAPFRRWKDGGTSGQVEDFWALRELDLDIEPGEVVGIIGRNGAGKSTLLKILSRITKPTTGRVDLHGRVGSLLEVGTGFHPELTGRENIYLNGAILGMSRREITRKFDEIIAFADVERFLDTPVKRYSSGMYVRLAFAVAAYLEPEILIVDEVLAVGDMAFQRKCLGRIQEVGRSGRTVLFVSHNMPSVEHLCTRGIMLDGGTIVCEGDVSTVVGEYRRRIMSASSGSQGFEPSAVNRPRPVFRSASLLDGDDEPTNFISLGEALTLKIELESSASIELPTILVAFDDTTGQRVLSLKTPLSRLVIPSIDGRCVVRCRVDQFPLAPGDYWVKLSLTTMGGTIDEVERALHFTVVDGEMFGEGRGFYRGVCVAPAHWKLVENVRALV